MARLRHPRRPHQSSSLAYPPPSHTLFPFPCVYSLLLARPGNIASILLTDTILAWPPVSRLPLIVRIYTAPPRARHALVPAQRTPPLVPLPSVHPLSLTPSSPSCRYTTGAARRARGQSVPSGGAASCRGRCQRGDVAPHPFAHVTSCWRRSLGPSFLSPPAPSVRLSLSRCLIVYSLIFSLHSSVTWFHLFPRAPRACSLVAITMQALGCAPSVRRRRRGRRFPVQLTAAG